MYKYLTFALVFVLVACVTTTTTLPDGTIIEEKAPNMEAIGQAMEFAVLVIDRLESAKATSPEEEQARLEAQIAQWQFYLEALEKLAGSLHGSRVERKIGLP